MGIAIGMIELTSIARGIEVSDFMVKSANIRLLRASSVCPGKFIVIVGGETGDVKAAMAVGEEKSGACMVDKLLIPSAHSQLIPAIHMTNQVDKMDAVGVIEFYSVASAIIAADVAAKAADITLIEVRAGCAIGGKGYVTLTGDVGAVREAVSAAEKNTELLVESTIIPRPSKEIFDSLM